MITKWLFLKDFTRNRKLPFETVFRNLISMGGNSICKELLNAHGDDSDMATISAFIQQRDKIIPYAFEFLFNMLMHSHSGAKKYQDYRLMAVDSSSLYIPTTPFGTDTHCCV